ncbi:MAG TPA: B12-binding domain-containing radical SAM protein [Candidatus Wujingus californicus]|uniref:B12-binding domain-containing radical SAM protein n=1 Tax=Candidatus Wujingus californicus TaxID=3367618 RepID=UPI00402A1935
MNFLFVVPKFVRAGQDYFFPIGLGYIVSHMKHKGFNVFCLNLCHYDDPIEQQLYKCIENKHIDVLCTGAMSFYWNEASEVIETAKKTNPEIITVVGGPVVTSDPKLALENMKFDYGVIGEGEITMAELAAALTSDGDLGKVRGLIFHDKDNGLTVTAPREAISDLDSLPFPDFEGFEYSKWLSISRDQLGGVEFDFGNEVRFHQITTSRSCPYNCTFCYHPLGQKYRQRSLDNVFQEIDYLVRKYNINILNILDELFSFDEKRVYEFSSRIKKYNIRWMAQWRADNVNENILKTLKDSGILSLGIGVESMSDKVLKSMKKHVTTADIDRAYNLACEIGVKASGNLIFGDPEETEETIRESLEWRLKHPEYEIHLRFLLAVPDSKVWRHAIEHNLINDKVRFIKNKFPVINLTKISDRKFNKIRRRIMYLDFTQHCFMKGKVLSSKKESDAYEGKPIYAFTVECPCCRQIYRCKLYRKTVMLYTIVVCKYCCNTHKIKTKSAFLDDYNAIYGFFYYALIIYGIYLKRFVFLENIAKGFKRVIATIRLLV